jgi:hypothetical protein
MPHGHDRYTWPRAVLGACGAFLGALGPPWLPEAPGLCVFVCVFCGKRPKNMEKSKMRVTDSSSCFTDSSS